MPGIQSREAGLIAIQSVLLVSRTWLTDYISRIEARAGRHLIAQVTAFQNRMFQRIVSNSGLLSRTESDCVRCA